MVNPMMMPGGMFGMVAGAPRKQPEDEEKKRQSYWQGGDKFTVRDGLAGALAAVGDGFSTWANGPSAGGATGMLIGGRGRAIEQAKAAQAQAMEAQQRDADLRAAGITPEQGRLLGDNVGSVIANRMRPEEMDAFDRDMARAGIMKGTPEYNQMAQQRAQRTAQGQPPIVTGAPIPGGTGTFTGYMDDYLGTYGSQQQQPQPSAPTAPVGRLTPVPTPNGAQDPIPQLQMNPQAQFYLDEATKAEMMAGARRDGRDYMQRMGY